MEPNCQLRASRLLHAPNLEASIALSLSAKPLDSENFAIALLHAITLNFQICVNVFCCALSLLFKARAAIASKTSTMVKSSSAFCLAVVVITISQLPKKHIRCQLMLTLQKHFFSQKQSCFSFLD
jgi:hypothetical protein